jgi:enoyl-CoA hydratase
MPVPKAEALLTERRGHVLVVTINRPRARNAITGEVAERIADAMDEFDRDPHLRAAILTGAGGTFSAGMDLKAALAGEPASVPGRGFGAITTSPPRKPLIAAVEGWALAGGCEMVLACDLVIAADNARFGLPEVKRGLAAGSGGLVRLPRRIPYHVAMELILTGDLMSARRAYALGLVNALAPAGQALDVALELAEKVAANGPLALAASKEVIRQGDGWTDEDVRRRHKGVIRSVMQSEDAVEGARAFTEKRAPVWRGR